MLRESYATMRSKVFMTGALAALSAVGCTSSAPESGVTVGALPKVQLRAEPTMISGAPLFGRCVLALDRTLGGDEDFGMAWDLLWVDADRLLVMDLFAPPYFFKMLSRGSGRVEHAFGREGGGPGEFRHPIGMFPSATRPGLIEIFDFNQRLNFFGWDGARAPSWQGEVSFRSEKVLRNIAPYRERYVGSGLFADYTLMVVDSAGSTVERLVTDPPFDPAKTGIRPGVAPLLTHALFAAHGERVAVAYGFEPYVDLIDLDDRAYRRVVGPEPAPTRFEVRDDGLHLSDDNVGAYAAVAVTDRLIFVLFDGLTYAETMEHLRERPNDPFDRIIHAFDWRGRYLAEIDTEHPFQTMEIDPEHRVLWTDHEDPFPRVAEWPLPPIIDRLDRLDRGEPASDLELCPDGRYGG